MKTRALIKKLMKTIHAVICFPSTCEIPPFWIKLNLEGYAILHDFVLILLPKNYASLCLYLNTHQNVHDFHFKGTNKQNTFTSIIYSRIYIYIYMRDNQRLLFSAEFLNATHCTWGMHIKFFNENLGSPSRVIIVCNSN